MVGQISGLLHGQLLVSTTSLDDLRVKANLKTASSVCWICKLCRTRGRLAWSNIQRYRLETFWRDEKREQEKINTVKVMLLDWKHLNLNLVLLIFTWNKDAQIMFAGLKLNWRALAIAAVAGAEAGWPLSVAEHLQLDIWMLEWIIRPYSKQERKKCRYRERGRKRKNWHGTWLED